MGALHLVRRFRHPKDSCRGRVRLVGSGAPSFREVRVGAFGQQVEVTVGVAESGDRLLPKRLHRPARRIHRPLPPQAGHADHDGNQCHDAERERAGSDRAASFLGRDAAR